MHRLFVFLFSLVSITVYSQGTSVHASMQPVDWVNPLMGTDSNYEVSNGNVYPTIARPWGMNFWMPQTGKMGDGWAYTYSATKIKGFKQTHQPSPWMNDYGQFSIMPITGDIKFKEEERQSWFSHKAETATPYYYKVYLADYNMHMEITPTDRAAVFRFPFPKGEKTHVNVDAFDKGSYVKVIPGENKVIGYTTRNSGGVPENFKNYFVIVFNKPISGVHTFDGDTLGKATEMKSNHAGAVVSFASQEGEVIEARVASSFFSPEQAELNLKETAGKQMGSGPREFYN